MLTNHFSIEEQKKFMILENETCHIHGKHPKITFPNGVPRIENCCCKNFDSYISSKIYKIEVQIIEARK